MLQVDDAGTVVLRRDFVTIACRALWRLLSVGLLSLVLFLLASGDEATGDVVPSLAGTAGVTVPWLTVMSVRVDLHRRIESGPQAIAFDTSPNGKGRIVFRDVRAVDGVRNSSDSGRHPSRVGVRVTARDGTRMVRPRGMPMTLLARELPRFFSV